MNIQSALIQGHYKATAQSIADYIIANPNSLEELMECFFSEDLRMCQRAAWPVGIIGKEEPQLLSPYFTKMLRALDHPRHDAVIRNTIRTFQNIEIPEDLSGELYEKCFMYLIDPKYPVAIKVFSMSVLTNIACKFSDLKDELIIAIQDQIPHATAGYLSRAKRELKRLKK